MMNSMTYMTHLTYLTHLTNSSLDLQKVFFLAELPTNH